MTACYELDAGGMTANQILLLESLYSSAGNRQFEWRDNQEKMESDTFYAEESKLLMSWRMVVISGFGDWTGCC